MSSDFAPARTIVRGAWRYCREDVGFVIATLTILSLPQVVADIVLTQSEATGIAMVLSLVTLYVQLLLTYRLLDRVGSAPPGYHRSQLTEGRYPTAFAASFLSGVGVLLGLLLLIVPGVVVFALWSLTLPVLVAERASTLTALRRSATIVRTAPAAVAIVMAVLAIAVAVAFGISFAFDLIDEPAGSIGFSLWLNLSISAIMLFSSAAWASAYLTLRPRSP